MIRLNTTDKVRFVDFIDGISKKYNIYFIEQPSAIINDAHVIIKFDIASTPISNIIVNKELRAYANSETNLEFVSILNSLIDAIDNEDLSIYDVWKEGDFFYYIEDVVDIVNIKDKFLERLHIIFKLIEEKYITSTPTHE